MSDVISYEPETETLRIGAREFDVLHLRDKPRAEVLHSVSLAMRELHGQVIVGAREIYRDTTIAIVPRLVVRFAPTQDTPTGVVVLPIRDLSETVPWWVWGWWGLCWASIITAVIFYLLSHH